MIDDKYINNFAKNKVSAIFHSRVIVWRRLGGHKYGRRKVTETSVVEWRY